MKLKENRPIRNGSCILPVKHVDNELAMPFHFNLFDHKQRLIRCFYIIGHNYHGHYSHAGGLSVNNYVRENIVREVNVRE